MQQQSDQDKEAAGKRAEEWSQSAKEILSTVAEISYTEPSSAGMEPEEEDRLPKTKKQKEIERIMEQRRKEEARAQERLRIARERNLFAPSSKSSPRTPPKVVRPAPSPPEGSPPPVKPTRPAPSPPPAKRALKPVRPASSPPSSRTLKTVRSAPPAPEQDV